MYNYVYYFINMREPIFIRSPGFIININLKSTVMDTINKLTELANTSSYLKSITTRYANLVYTVEINRGHISELESLINLFKGGLTSYHKEYNKEVELITVLFENIVEATRKNHYVRKSEDVEQDNIYNLMAALYPEKTFAKRDDVRSEVVRFNMNIGR